MWARASSLVQPNHKTPGPEPLENLTHPIPEPKIILYIYFTNSPGVIGHTMN